MKSYTKFCSLLLGYQGEPALMPMEESAHLSIKNSSVKASLQIHHSLRNIQKLKRYYLIGIIIFWHKGNFQNF